MWNKDATSQINIYYYYYPAAAIFAKPAILIGLDAGQEIAVSPGT